MTTMRPEAVATIFSISSAPPPPLMRRSSLSSSSAPSTVRSRNGCWSSVMSGMPRRSACARVASEVGTHLTLRPAFTFCPTRSTKRAAVEPVPSPKVMPSSTSFSARSAACCFQSSAVMQSPSRGSLRPHRVEDLRS